MSDRAQLPVRAGFFAVVLFAGCWGDCPSNPGWPATAKAGFERMAADRLKECVQSHECFEEVQRRCFTDSEAYCVDAGYPKSCGQMEPEGTCGVGVK